MQGVAAGNAATDGEWVQLKRSGAQIAAGLASTDGTADRSMSRLPSHVHSPHTPTCVLVQLFPVSRSSFLKRLFGADFSHLIKFHRWAAWGTQVLPTPLILMAGTALYCLLSVSHKPCSGAPLSVPLITTIAALHCLLYMTHEL